MAPHARSTSQSDPHASKRVFPSRPRSQAARREAAQAIADRLAQVYPVSHVNLTHSTPFQLLVATVLSAQTTDMRVNQTTPALFARYPTPEDLAQADLAELEELLHPVGFFRVKARHIRDLARTLVDHFHGEVPVAIDDLVTLPGVGRKTANVVRGDAFGLPGITVDTHVGRSARRWGWSRSTDPIKVEQDIASLLPSEIWTVTCHRIIDHGRAICHSRNPECSRCPLADLCPSFEILRS
ncbi:MAG: endonuclease III [Actinomycetaceae bacterium]|nr:endonuclease III [Actinomycetaceae bacterium]MDY6082490.1 endonuclease III [Actinomycetaceae bacterium]